MKTLLDLKKMYALGLSFAKGRVSSETKLFHFSYEEPLSRDTIPIFENFCYVLALLRSHQSDLMLEAREILQRLLAFQGEMDTFPIYLHQYPKTYSKDVAVLQLVALFRIQDEYGHILGDKVRSQLGHAIATLAKAVLEIEPSPVRQYLKGAVLFKLGLLSAPEEEPKYYSSAALGEIVLANDLLEKETVIPWHDALQIYSGSLLDEYQDGFSPQLSLLDCLLKEKVVPNHPNALIATLFLDPKIQTYSDESLSREYLLQIESHCEKPTKGFHNLRLATKSHTLVIQQKDVVIQPHGENTFLLTLPKTEFTDESKDVEWSIFINCEPTIDILVNGVKASMFYLHDDLTIEMDQKKFQVKVEVFSGSANICGHLARGNRSSQVAPNAKTEWKAYDWQIAYRTLSRSPDCTLLLTIQEIKSI